jgi:polysaccharide export outer membrane protein
VIDSQNISAVASGARHRTASRAATSLGLAALTAIGCGGVPLVPAVPSAEDGFAAVGSPTPSGVRNDPPQAAALYPGDIVTLRLMSLETREVAGLSVDERGMLHVPLAGDVQVAGLPLTEAEDRIEHAMQRFDRAVRVTVVVADPAGHQATVIGAVGDQGRVTVVPGMRVADLLAAAGGPTVSEETGVAMIHADLLTARLVRDGRPLPISLALAVTGDVHHNIRVRPGDHLYVPPQLGSLVSVLGEVETARVLPYRGGLRLSQALAMAGGITRDANGGDIHIVRGLPSRPRHYHAAINQVIAGQVPDPILAPGDVVYVGSSALADFRDVIATIAPLITLAGTTAVSLAIAYSVP